MPELKYLKDKKIVFRDEPFVMDVIYSMEKGNASIQLYDIFPGVQLMVTDFQSDTCYQSGMEQDGQRMYHPGIQSERDKRTDTAGRNCFGTSCDQSAATSYRT